MPPTEYYVARVGGEDDKKGAFTVAKFEGSSTPSAVYLVIWDKTKDQMACECPNKRRSAHIDDKHGEVVREWLAAGEPTRAFSAKSQSRQAPPRHSPYQDPEDGSPF